MKPRDITIIVAVAHDGAIGRRGDLAFHISADLKHFKALTMGSTLIMGRKTFESLPGGPLPGRRNIVVTRNASWTRPGVDTAGSLDEAIRLAGDGNIFIIGGGEIYRTAMPRATRLELTEIDADAPDADTFFPTIDQQWHTIDAGEWTVDPRSGLRYRFLTLVK